MGHGNFRGGGPGWGLGIQTPSPHLEPVPPHQGKNTSESPWKEKSRQSQWNLQLPFPSAAGIEIIRIITGNQAK